MPSKGQTLSVETKQKMNVAKQQKMKSKYKWEYAEPYYDVELNISSNKTRSKQFITLRQFKELLENGKSLKDIKRGGASKHLIQFYSAFCQGKITISKEEFIEQYDKGFSLEEICKKNDIPKDHIGFLRQLFEKKKTGAKYIKRKKTESPLTQRQKDIIYGSMMGDAKKMSSSSVAFNHGDEQKEYLLWKYNELKNISSANSLKGEPYTTRDSGKECCRWSFYTFANTDLEICISKFYQNGIKEISFELLDSLSPLSIAVWFQDDGTTDWGHRSKIHGINSRPTFKFCTDSFSLESCKNIQSWFKDKYNIDTSLSKRVLSDRIGYRVDISKNSIDVFIELIKPHILPMFQYKINYDSYVSRRKGKETRIINGDALQCPLGADFSKLTISEQDRHIEDIVLFYQNKGIEFLIEQSDNWKSHLDSVLNHNSLNLLKNEYVSFSNLGNNFLMSHFPNFWSAKAKGGDSPKNIFNNNHFLSDIIRKIIIQGYFPSREKIKKALYKYRGNKQVSGFMPCVAKAIYHKYCNEDSRVFDFCAGYGGRLFGAASCDKVKSYTGTDSNFETYMNLNNFHQVLRIHGEVFKEISIFNQDSILSMKKFSDKSFDFCFTSPPYYDAEIYSDEETQSFNQYPSYSEWFSKYLIASIKEAMRISHKVAINISNTGGYMIADDFENWLKDNDIEYVKDFMSQPAYGSTLKKEPIFVF